MGAKPSGSRLGDSDAAQGDVAAGLDLSIQNASGLTFELFHVEPSALEPQVPMTIPAAADFRLVCASADIGLAFAAAVSHGTTRPAQAISNRMGAKTKKIDLRDGVTRQVLAISISRANLRDRGGRPPALYVSLRTGAAPEGLFAGQPVERGLQGTCSWEVHPERKTDGSFSVSIKVAKTRGVVVEKRAALLDRLQGEAQKRSTEEAMDFLGSVPARAAETPGNSSAAPAVAGSSQQGLPPVASAQRDQNRKDDEACEAATPDAAPAARECEDEKLPARQAPPAAPAMLVSERGAGSADSRVQPRSGEREESRAEERAAAPEPSPESAPAPTRSAQLAQQVLRGRRLEQERRDEELRQREAEARERQVLRESQEAEFQESVLVDTVQQLQRDLDDVRAQMAPLEAELETTRELARRSRERLQRYGDNPRLRADAEAAEQRASELEEQLRPLGERLDELTPPLLEKQELLDVLRAAA